MRPCLSRRRETPTRRATCLGEAKGLAEEGARVSWREEKRRCEARRRNAPEEARISRATEVSGTRPKDRMRRRRRRGSGAPRRLSRRTGKADRDSEEERPVPTTRPRRRAREPAPRRVPPAESVQADLRPLERDLAGATEEAAARQPAKLSMATVSCGSGRPLRCG